MNFKENLKKLRIKKGLTQIELAKKLNISLETIRRYEQDRAQPQKLEILEQLTFILECDYNDLLGDEDVK